MMCASKVSRSTIAAHSLGSVKVEVHSEKAAPGVCTMKSGLALTVPVVGELEAHAQQPVTVARHQIGQRLVQIHATTLGPPRRCAKLPDPLRAGEIPARRGTMRTCCSATRRHS